jgi:hypothetical protein
MPIIGLALLLGSFVALPPAIDAMPEPPRPDLAPLLPEPRWTTGSSLPAFTRALDHKVALEADPLHRKAFWVEELAGDPSSRRVVFLIPQFHRNPIVPIEWTSLGSAIVHVQSNIDGLVTRLSRAHGMKCIGTEGSWNRDIGMPVELRQAAQWLTDLERARPTAWVALQREKKPGKEHLDVIFAKLRAALRLRVALYDGVGVGLERIGPERSITRFGIEDAELNRASLVLLAKLQRIDERLAVLNPAAQSDIQSAMGRMWLDEIDAYEAEVLKPLRESIAALDEQRTRLRAAGADGPAEDLGRFVSLAKHVSTSVVKPDEIAGYTAYYRRVGTKTDAGPTPQQKAERPLSLEEKRESAELKAARAPLQTEYEALSIDERERRAAHKVVQRLGPVGSCAVVMGAVHKDALKQKLLEAGKGDLAVIVVAPYSFDGVD